ncbi:C4-dicarboxylate ABC transporter substrate-binding protein [Enterovibrio norvegicus]|uniref:TRAP transporter substrate-binding protein DctP n=1 Tax=Enterovibrio norvegicus TaxID=188144 RepID=UPI0002EE9183|nr:TRAP transporter substrate-binding protein DctP [Enterovibrio norvegicus]MCC4800639.1 TRAP transporter substrate-binding protein DctP [Enterovibrio norvegicus]OEE60728.1 C4-dicarboxylate ABC transporter substrate-binding protein [Enterovibrio norvegicus]OEF63797.1 C4-dicarboxylate ABC transporter substrate-binding protein [Enterovibrio norvegicus]PMH67233.1 C4-dicarboxylate ABC transporter substrate-binding protein [Enterovibrio norvegicus]PMI31787.1 C4-dicarboxylate ABC transporter substra
MKFPIKTNALKLSLITCALMSAMPMAASAAETIRLSTYVNESDIRYEGFKKFAELAAAKSNGDLKVQIFPSGTLHGWSEGVDAVQGGVSDISWIPADKRLPCYRVTSLYPVAIDLEKQVELDDTYASLIEAEAAKADLIPLINSNYSYDQEWWFEDAVTDIGKLDGKLVRSIGPLVSMMIETWGGKPVFVAPKEVFQSAERGVVDGINMGVATYSSWKLWSVMPHMVNANMFYGNIIYMMNKDKFDDLSPANQKALKEAATEAEAWLKPRYEGWVDERVGNAVMANGGSAVSMSEDRTGELLEGIVAKWTPEVNNACGVPLADNIRSLFAKHSE